MKILNSCQIVLPCIFTKFQNWEKENPFIAKHPLQIPKSLEIKFNSYSRTKGEKKKKERERQSSVYLRKQSSYLCYFKLFPGNNPPAYSKIRVLQITGTIQRKLMYEMQNISQDGSSFESLHLGGSEFYYVIVNLKQKDYFQSSLCVDNATLPNSLKFWIGIYRLHSDHLLQKIRQVFWKTSSFSRHIQR